MLRSDGQVTRARVLDAAIECILETGYYEASSNAIARHAGVTWGTLQHQFGTRQGLLLEVIDDRWRRLVERIESTEITGATLEDRLQHVMAVLETHYGDPEHLVLLQIMLDLLQAPSTTESTRQAVLRHGQQLVRVWQPLFAQALGEAAQDRELVRFAFLTIRGYLSSNLVASRLGRDEPDDEVRRLVIRGVACAIRERAAAQGLGVGDDDDPAAARAATPKRRRSINRS